LKFIFRCNINLEMSTESDSKSIPCETVPDTVLSDKAVPDKTYIWRSVPNESDIDPEEVKRRSEFHSAVDVYLPKDLRKIVFSYIDNPYYMCSITDAYVPENFLGDRTDGSHFYNDLSPVVNRTTKTQLFNVQSNCGFDIMFCSTETEGYIDSFDFSPVPVSVEILLNNTPRTYLVFPGPYGRYILKRDKDSPPLFFSHYHCDVIEFRIRRETLTRYEMYTYLTLGKRRSADMIFADSKNGIMYSYGSARWYVPGYDNDYGSERDYMSDDSAPEEESDW
jgi:hypothetical protein